MSVQPSTLPTTSLRAGLLAFINRRVRQPADAEDIVQVVFLRLHESAPTLPSESSLHAWLYRTARNAITDYYRSAVRRREVTGDEALEAAEHRTDEERAHVEPLALQELAACLRPLVATLDEADQEALTLVDLGDHTHAEAAVHAGVSVSGMKSRTQRARQRLRAAVDACCQVELDSRNAVAAFEPRRSDAGVDAGCGCSVPGADPTKNVGKCLSLVPGTSSTDSTHTTSSTLERLPSARRSRSSAV